MDDNDASPGWRTGLVRHVTAQPYEKKDRVIISTDVERVGSASNYFHSELYIQLKAVDTSRSSGLN